MIRDDWVPLRAIGTFTRRGATGTLIETYHDGYEVNETGAFVWSQVGASGTVLDIAGKLAARYDLTVEYSAEVVRGFLAELCERGFIPADPRPAEPA
jgi:Coenzyme PQQ synthesis protein D (PqqD)